MKEITKYSVLMSLYKKEKAEYLRQALDSIINQTIIPDEIVLVEDGPLTKELYNVLDEYEKKCNLRRIKNEVNLGLGLALNHGLKECRNELIARMDTDDIAVLDRCEKQLSYYEKNPNTTILGGQIEEFIVSPEKIVGQRIVPETNKDLKEFMKKRCPFNHMTVMFKKTDILKSGNYRDWFWNEDYYLWIRLGLKKYIFANLPDTLVYTRVGEEMYKRRGGVKYFKSEERLQRFMYKKHIISLKRYIINTGERFLLQVLMPNCIRGWVFRTFARE